MPPLTSLFPSAEKLGEAADGAALWRLRCQVPGDGSLTRQGYSCPASTWGGPPAPALLALLTGESNWAEVDPTTILYLDTETTGLATGAGSLAFLIGLGRFTPSGAFEVDQYFIDDFAAEPLLIEAVDARLRAAGGLVTFNGRTFDLPLMAARWVLARRPPRFPELHLDLLHFARRLWRLRLTSCSLGSVERHILYLQRFSDLPSHLIPGIWLDAQRGLHAERLVPVFDHHAQDIASMGALAALFTLAVRQPDHPGFSRAEDQWGLARMAEARGDRAAATLCLEAAVLAARDADLEFRLAMHLARTYKRLGRADDAVAIWRARVAQCRPHRLDPLIELAKHAEHVLKDFDLAGEWTRQALALLEGQTDLEWRGVAASLDPAERLAQIEALHHRLARQQRRQQLPSTGRGRKKKK